MFDSTRWFLSVLKQSCKRHGKLKHFYKDFKKFVALDKKERLPVSRENIYPCLDDYTVNTQFDGHYIFHPAWAARVIREISPDKHIDISSTLAFCTMLSAFIATEFYDYRPALLELDNLISAKADLTSLDFESGSIVSLSCMHTIEHIGLGRYGDPVDPEGDTKAIKELMRVCAQNGNLIIAVPVGAAKVAFNAHRVYNPVSFAGYFTGFTLKEFSLITDDNKFIRNAPIEQGAAQTYGCGCFWFVKKY